MINVEKVASLIYTIINGWRVRLMGCTVVRLLSDDLRGCVFTFHMPAQPGVLVTGTLFRMSPKATARMRDALVPGRKICLEGHFNNLNFTSNLCSMTMSVSQLEWSLTKKEQEEKSVMAIPLCS